MLSTTELTSNVSSLVSPSHNNVIKPSSKSKKEEFKPMNYVDNQRQKSRTGQLHKIIRNVSQTKEVERKSKRQRRTTSFYFEESLMMPSSRESKFFQRPVPPTASSHMKWNQILQQIQFVESDTHSVKPNVSFLNMEASNSNDDIPHQDSNYEPHHRIGITSNTNGEDRDITSSYKRCSLARKSLRISRRQSTISLDRANELQIANRIRQASRIGDCGSPDNSDMVLPCTKREESIQHSDITIVVQKSAITRTNLKKHSTERRATQSYEQKNTKNGLKSKQGHFEIKSNSTPFTRSSRRLSDKQVKSNDETQLTERRIQPNLRSIEKVKPSFLTTYSVGKEKWREGIDDYVNSLKSPTVTNQNERLFKDGWKVVGDQFPSERICTGGYHVSFSVLLDRYDRNARQGKYESVDFGPTIDTAKTAITRLIKTLRSRGENESFYVEGSLDDGHRLNKRAMTAFEDQERLERAREKESDFFASRRYNCKTHKKTKDDTEMRKLTKSAIVFEEDRQRRQTFTSCAVPCAICHGSTVTNLEPGNLAHSLMPLYRPYDHDHASEVEGDYDGIQVQVKSRRSRCVAQKGLQTLMALKELSNTLEFIETYYAGYPKWGVNALQSK
jgi:hypothetical protein